MSVWQKQSSTVGVIFVLRVVSFLLFSVFVSFFSLTQMTIRKPFVLITTYFTAAYLVQNTNSVFKAQSALTGSTAST